MRTYLAEQLNLYFSQGMIQAYSHAGIAGFSDSSTELKL